MRYIKISFTALFISTLGIVLSYGQDCEELSANLFWNFEYVGPSTNLEQDDEFFIQCSVDGFVDMLAFQYTLEFDESVLEFQSLDDIDLPLIGPVESSYNPQSEYGGKLAILWTNTNGQNQTLEDNTEIYKVFFKVIGNPGECIQFEISSSLIELEIAHLFDNGEFCVELTNINYNFGEEGSIINCVTSTQELANSSFKLFPNPSSGIFNIDVNLASKATIYNTAGNKLLEFSLQEGLNLIELDQLKSGIYFIEIHSSEKFVGIQKLYIN